MKNFLKKILVVVLLVITITSVNAQVKVGSSQSNVSKAIEMCIAGLPHNVQSVTLWEMIPNGAYTMVYATDERLYMRDIYADRWTYGRIEAVHLLSTSNSGIQFRLAEDTGERFVLNMEYLLGYVDGVLVTRWPNILRR